MSVASVRARVGAACERSGRAVDDVTLVAVAKYATVAQVRAVVADGLVDVGENHAQQLRDRAGDVPGVRWHMIGPLQSNKARYVARLATAFHALDRVEVAEALSARRAGPDVPPGPLECFVQVNFAGEATKAGVAPDAVGALVDACAPLPGVRVVGLMAMPPLPARAEDSRPWFRALGSLARAHGLAGLSMGTTADFEVAVEEGATVIRVGAALFAPG